MTATIFYESGSELALLNVTFTLGGTPTDPGTVSCVITDPSGTAVTHTYLGAAPYDIAKVSPGVYQLSVPCNPAITGIDGLWSYVWIASTTVNDVQPGTWRVMPSTVGNWLVGLDELKDRMGITDTADDSQAQIAIQSATQTISDYCGRHFYRITETRTYQPHNIWLLEIDDLISVTAFNMDIDGDGTFETPMVQNVDYQLRYGHNLYNANILGWARPYRQAQIIQTGKWFPFTWPYTHLDRIQIAGTWGWPAVPPPVTEAAFLLAADLLKLKDAPFGLAGNAEFGVLQVRSNPWVSGLLNPYINPRHKVGVL
jgi:gp6-like head-tail connector protein